MKIAVTIIMIIDKIIMRTRKIRIIQITRNI